MASFSVILVAVISVVAGVGGGLGAGYLGLNPQVNAFSDQLEERSSQLSVSQEGGIGMQQVVDLLNKESLSKDEEIVSLKEEMKMKESELVDLQSRIQQLRESQQRDLMGEEERGILMGKVQSLEGEVKVLRAEIERGRDLLRSIESPQLKLILPEIVQKVRPDDPDEHLVRGWVVNFGANKASSATLTIEFLEGPCPCQAQLLQRKIVMLTDIPGRSVVEINESYFFDLDQEKGKIINTDFSWR